MAKLCPTPTAFLLNMRSRSRSWSRILKVSVSEVVVSTSEGLVSVLHWSWSRIVRSRSWSRSRTLRPRLHHLYPVYIWDKYKVYVPKLSFFRSVWTKQRTAPFCDPNIIVIFSVGIYITRIILNFQSNLILHLWVTRFAVSYCCIIGHCVGINDVNISKYKFGDYFASESARNIFHTNIPCT